MSGLNVQSPEPEIILRTCRTQGYTDSVTQTITSINDLRFGGAYQNERGTAN